MNLWNLWWFRHALVELGQSPFDCQFVFYPTGANLWHHTLAPFHGLLGLPLQSFLSLAATQNTLLFLQLIAAATLTFALALRLGANRAGAFLAGAVFAFCPYVFAHLYVGHYELLAHAWLPLFLLLYLRLTDVPAWRDGIGLGLAFAAAAYSCQYYVVYGVELLLLTVLLAPRRLLRQAVLLRLATGVAVAALGMLPVLQSFLDSHKALREAPPTWDFTWLSGDLLSFFVPSFTHPLLGEPLKPLLDRLTPAKGSLYQESTLYLGYSTLILAFLGSRQCHRKQHPLRWLLLAIVLVFSVLSLGSVLKVGGQVTGISLPAKLLLPIPVLQEARAPGRFILLASLGLALLAGLGWPRVATRGRWALVALLAFEYAAFPLPLHSTGMAPAYQRLAEVRTPFALLEIPSGFRDGRRHQGQQINHQLLAQTVHGHPVVSGMASRLPTATWKKLASMPIVSTLHDPKGPTPEAVQRDQQQGLAYFQRWRIEAILLHPVARNGPQQHYIEQLLPIRGREDFPDGSQLLWVKLD